MLLQLQELCTTGGAISQQLKVLQIYNSIELDGSCCCNLQISAGYVATGQQDMLL